MLRVEGLSAGYGRVTVLKGVSLDVARGEVIALIGSNGAGKTTLLRTLSGVHPASGGQIVFEDQPITAWSPGRRIAHGIAQSPEGRQVFGPLTVEENLRLGAFRRKDAGIAEDRDKVFALFPVLAERRSSPAAALSGGQQQMLAIGRALMARPKLLLLDEPSLGLAPVLAQQIFRTVAELAKAGSTILLVEQNAAAALTIADRGYVMETGRIVQQGPTKALLGDAAVQRAYLGM